MKLQVMNVTPEQAKAWLKVNSLNRPVRESYVNYLADSMRRGEWMVNHQPVALNGNRLIDGQHRLMAVIRSEMPAVKMAVITDADTSTFDTIDIGVKRTHSDIFREDAHVMNPVSMIARMIYGQRTTPRMVKPIYEKLHKEMRQVVDAIPRNTKKWTAAPIRVAALAAILNGESKTYVLGLYKAMATFDAKNLPPVGAALVRQVTMGPKSGKSVGSKYLDLMVRAYTTFQKENAELQWVGIKKASVRMAEIREIYKKTLGIS